MAYPQTLQDLINDVMSRLGLPVNTPAAQLAPGTGTAAVRTSADTITQYLNEAASELVRRCYPIHDTATGRVAASTRFVPFSSLTSTLGGVLWAARSVTWNGVALKHTSRSALELWYRTWQTDAAAAPTQWYEQGVDGIGLYPVPLPTCAIGAMGLGATLQSGLVLGGAGVLSVAGLSMAPQMSDLGAVSPFQPDLGKLLVFNACVRVAEKNTQDTSLGARADEWRGEWEGQTLQLLARLWRIDRDLAEAHFPALPSGK